MVKRKRLIVFLVTCIAFIGVIATGYATHRESRSTVSIGDARLEVRVPRTNTELMHGLSDSQPLNDDEGMLFIFPSSNKWGIWMKDMKYPIDIIWLNDEKKVVYIVDSAQPASYPKTTYTPPENATYVLETKAGVAKHKRITIGSNAVFDDSKGTYE